MPEPLIETEAQLGSHFSRVQSIVAAIVDSPRSPQIDVSWATAPVTAGFDGTGCEFIFRNRGLRTPVVPLLHLRQGLWAWLGYREEWEEERRNRDVRRLSFKAVSLTLFFGWLNDAFKPQMFRAEWSGWSRWGGADYEFQAGSAGHPHWQFDALESLMDSDTAGRAEALKAILTEEQAGIEVREFSPTLPAPDVRDTVKAEELSRIHFASAAAWWRPSPYGDHAHGPTTLHELEVWLEKTLSYVKIELRRL